MKYSILLAGFGGQGILVMSKMIAKAATEEGKEVTWMPSYEGGKRGGATISTVIISDKKVLCPVSSEGETDVVVVMDQRSMNEYQDFVKPNGYLFVNSSIIREESKREDVNVIKIPANKIADELGATRSANMVMCAHLVKTLGFVEVENVFNQIAEAFLGNEEAISINKEAFKAGLEYAG